LSLEVRKGHIFARVQIYDDEDLKSQRNHKRDLTCDWMVWRVGLER